MSDILADYREWRDQQAARVSTHSAGCHMWHERCMIDRLADALGRARLNLEEQVPRWIPTDESLPDVDDHVLIFCPFLEPEETTCADRQKNGMWVCDDGQLLGATEPTHWMPLPPPPTDDK